MLGRICVAVIGVALLFSLADAAVSVELTELNAALPQTWKMVTVSDNALPKDYEHAKAKLPRGLYIGLQGPKIPENHPDPKARGLQGWIELWFMPLEFDENALPAVGVGVGSQTGAAEYLGSNKQYKFLIKSSCDKKSWPSYRDDLMKAFDVVQPKPKEKKP